MIRKLTHFEQPVVTQEPETNATQQPAVPVSSSLGIAGTSDQFESVSPMPTELTSLDLRTQVGGAAPQVVSQEKVNASSMFDAFQQQFQSPFDAHYDKRYSQNVQIAGEKIKLNANVNANPQAGLKTATEANITLANDQNLNIGDATYDGAHAALSENMRADENVFESIGGAIVDGAGDVVDFVADLPSDAVDFITYLPDDAANFIFDAGYKVQTAVEDVGEAIDDAGSAVGEFFSDTVVGDGARMVGEFAEDVGDLAFDATWTFFDSVGDVGEFIGDVAEETPIPEVLDAAGTAIGDTANFLTNLVFAPVATIDEAIEDTGNTIEEVAEDTGDIIIGGIRITAEVIEDVVNETGNFVGNAAETVGGAISDGVDFIGDGLDDLF